MNETRSDRGGRAARPKPVKERRAARKSALPPVVYTIKVLSPSPGEARNGALRTVLFQRIHEGDAIEISAETDAPDLLSMIPDFLDAALGIQPSAGPAKGSLGPSPSSFFPHLAEESRRVRRLFERGAGGEREAEERYGSSA